MTASGPYLTREQLAAEYRATAERWRALCADRPPDLLYDREPLAVLILSGLCQPLPYRGERFTGDLILDVLGGLRSFVNDVDIEAARGGGDGTFLHGVTIEAWLRRCDTVIELRERELAARQLPQTSAV